MGCGKHPPESASGSGVPLFFLSDPFLSARARPDPRGLKVQGLGFRVPSTYP